jgi:hypothetical protein
MNQPACDREAFEAAYRAWRATTAGHEAKMARAVDEGNSIDWLENVRAVEELARLHRAFMEKSKPFVQRPATTSARCVVSQGSELAVQQHAEPAAADSQR